MSDSCICIYEELVAFPASMIKSPGSLLPKTKSTRDEDRSSQLTSDSTDRESMEISVPIDLVRLVKSESCSGPLERQHLEISYYDIKLESSLDSSMTNLAWDYIVKELKYLPQSFVVRLQLRIILTEKPTIYQEKHCIRNSHLKTPQRAKERLYYIMFQSLLVHFPNIFSLWAELNNYESCENNIYSSEVHSLIKVLAERALESSFYAIMFNKSYSKGLYIVKFKELLMILDPTSFSPKWFKNYNRRLKKAYKVKFDDDSGQY